MRKTAIAQVVAVAVGNYADGHVASRINGATILSTATGVLLRTMGLRFGCLLRLGHFLVLGFANGVMKIERDHLLRGKAHSQRALRAIGPRIDEGIEFEFDAQFLLGKTL